MEEKPLLNKGIRKITGKHCVRSEGTGMVSPSGDLLRILCGVLPLRYGAQMLPENLFGTTY